MRELKIIFRDGTIATYSIPVGVDYTKYLRIYGEIYMREVTLMECGSESVIVPNNSVYGGKDENRSECCCY